MQFLANFYFHHALNDFLLYSKRATWIHYSFKDSPAIKDAIEAIGVPHPEVGSIIVNGLQVSFSYPLANGDQVEVYPVIENHLLQKNYLLRPNPSPDKFILDVHLGSLAKLLRLLVFSTLYQNNYSDKTIVFIANTEQRIVLTRDIGLLKHRSVQWGYWLRSQQAQKQVIEVIRCFQLASRFRFFERCLACNGQIDKVDKEVVCNKLPPETIQYFNDFYRCASCKRVYWKGSHYDRMQQTIEGILKALKDTVL